LPVYGTQIEQARVGYNPRKRGRPSYHPLLCFEGATRDYWHGELRSGDAHTAKGAAELLDVCFATLRATVRKIRVRAVKGFFDHRLIERIEAHHARFVIVARITKPIRLRLSGLTYTPVTHADRFAVAEFSYQPHGWKQAYRFVAIRRPLPDELAEQVTLFTLGRYAYQVMVTNLGYRPSRSGISIMREPRWSSLSASSSRIIGSPRFPPSRLPPMSSISTCFCSSTISRTG
jgi:hypothetical protein